MKLTAETFFSRLIFHPFEADTKKDKVIALASSIACGIFTLGLCHLVCVLRNSFKHRPPEQATPQERRISEIGNSSLGPSSVPQVNTSFAMQDSHEDKESRKNQVRTLIAEGKFSEAKTISLPLTPDENAELFLSIAENHFKNRDYVLAMSSIDRFCHSSQKGNDLLVKIASLLIENNDFKVAERVIRSISSPQKKSEPIAQLNAKREAMKSLSEDDAYRIYPNKSYQELKELSNKFMENNCLEDAFLVAKHMPEGIRCKLFAEITNKYIERGCYSQAMDIAENFFWEGRSSRNIWCQKIAEACLQSGNLLTARRAISNITDLEVMVSEMAKLPNVSHDEASTISYLFDINCFKRILQLNGNDLTSASLNDDLAAFGEILTKAKSRISPEEAKSIMTSLNALASKHHLSLVPTVPSIQPVEKISLLNDKYLDFDQKNPFLKELYSKCKNATPETYPQLLDLTENFTCDDLEQAMDKLLDQIDLQNRPAAEEKASEAIYDYLCRVKDSLNAYLSWIT